MLRVFDLIFHGVHERHAGAVDCFESMPVPGVPGLDPLFEDLFDLLVNLVEEAVFDARPRPAVSAGVACWNGQSENAAPRLNHAEALRAAGVAFENLAKPGPENREMTEVAISVGGIDLGEKSGR